MLTNVKLFIHVFCLLCPLLSGIFSTSAPFRPWKAETVASSPAGQKRLDRIAALKTHCLLGSLDMIEVIDQSCVGCGACLKACAYGAIRIVDKLAVIDAEKCTLCGACVQACPFDAIVIRKKGEVQADLQDHQGIWVFAEQKDGSIAPVVFELLGRGRELADQMAIVYTSALTAFGGGIRCYYFGLAWIA